MISVIVPIYNVETYLPQCLDSLVAQTFPNVEFLLIDDGSTDDSGKIADKYTVDKRFRVWHTSNQGLSSARNLVIEQARGEWLMFVDGDDWVTADFCEKPYNMAIKNNADLVIFQFFSVKKTGIKAIVSGAMGQRIPINGIVDTKTAIKNNQVCVWNKLYKRTLFQNIRFPASRVYEDISITHKLFFSAEKILLTPDPLYYHFHRKGSIKSTRSAKYARDMFISTIERYEDLKSKGYEKNFYISGLISSSLLLMTRTFPSDDPVYHKAETILNAFNEIPSEWSWKRKTMLRLWRADKRLFHFICRVLKKKDSGNRSD